MNLRTDLLNGIERFLDVIPAQTRKRGRDYQANGHVIELECVEPDHLFAAIVRGSKDYRVGLEYSENHWFSDCSCPMNYDCKHVVAAILELQRRALANSENSAAQSKKKTPSLAQNQPPDSPLYRRLVENLGRRLSHDEANFIRRAQAAYENTRLRNFTENDLDTICRTGEYYSWRALDIWPERPRDDFHFWIYVAQELRRRNIRYPEFMDGITDFGLIEEEMAEWQRAKEIARWNHWFQNFDSHAVASQSGMVELRLMLNSDEARLQWRSQPGVEFADFKQTHAKRFAEQFERGALNLAADSLPLWSALFKPWHYESWWALKYSNSTARPALNRLLRLPLAPESIVTENGKPLARVAEPMRLELRLPENGSGDYVLKLVTAEGNPPPEIFCALSGRPTLYLTSAGLFQGPAADALDRNMKAAIPVSALETAEGLNFLHATGIPMPEHLSRRVKNVPVKVAISCALQPVYPGSKSEDIVLNVTAKASGMKTEIFTPDGWISKSDDATATKKKSAKETISIHDRAAQRHFPTLLENLGVKWTNYHGEWTLRLTKKNPAVFAAWLRSIPPEIEVRLDNELATLRDEPVSGSLSLDVQEAAMDWFDLKVVLDVGDTTLTKEELKLLLNARGGYVRLGDKGWRRLQFNLTPEEDEQLARIGLNIGDFSAEPQRFHALQLADDAAKKFLAPERVEQIRRRVSELKTRVAPTLPKTIRAEMRPYQTDGFHFLAYLTSNRFGGVLADDMGLGKTLQTLAWLAWLREATLDSQSSTLNSSLVVCPKSVTDNWRAEAERFFPDLRVRIWRGESAEELSAARETADLIVINYAQLRSLSPEIARVQWLAAILDEAQYIKNPDSQTAQAARALKADYRLALTGTPIENRLLDLWSILAFSMPGALGNRAHFLRSFNAKDDPLARRRLAARVRPFLLRRAKSQVAKDLPDRVEEDLLCEMEGEQNTLYRAELKRARQLILGLQTHKQFNDQRFNVLTSLLRLRQICCHPALVNPKLRGAESAKLSALEDLLEPLMEEGHKVLVFSQFVTMLDLLRGTMKRRNWKHFYLAGETENRGKIIEDFQSGKDGAVFLISLKAGGFGLNLTAASYVVLFDPWWNPAVENQAIDRTHRIGQTSKVMAYRLLVRDSVEQKIRALQKQKAALASDVLGEERFAQSLTLDDLRFLFAD